MKCAMLLTGNGPIVILTSYDSIENPKLLERLNNKGIPKFLAYEIPLELAEQRYGGHFRKVTNGFTETDDLRVLDHNGHRAFNLFSWDELGEPLAHEAPLSTHI
ncbi:hypothetical protein MARPU_03120 [Marichromatium purpuratum 984]|uniref:Cytosolic protein n=3 Tax=Chromatiaceae TaxID=1046 RepID=W0E177_MARPU|nr:hypothetical protein MARPU_03120 [Marichromatium purpuratum 984]MBK1710383.1 hypothetical protein [Marichromatium gracile]MBO8085675.1 hypothetical protein [Marichromatium sp.]RNE90644.1 hypothetical protein EBL84_06950 [Marichromatium sp. AB31]RNE92799.1 hypothetical protein EBL85_10325 [Marichromatium sp. AB32]